MVANLSFLSENHVTPATSENIDPKGGIGEFNDGKNIIRAASVLKYEGFGTLGKLVFLFCDESFWVTGFGLRDGKIVIVGEVKRKPNMLFVEICIIGIIEINGFTAEEFDLFESPGSYQGV
jgi:hypothetical protein